MATTACDIRRSPIDASVSWRVMDPEYYTIGALAQLPGLYGFRVQDRVKTGTMSIVYNTTGGSSFVQVTAAPVSAGQFFLDETTGLVICNALDVGQSIVANYQGGGTIFSLDQITTIAAAAGSSAGSGPDVLQKYVTGLFLSNSVGDPTNDIDISPGCAIDSGFLNSMILVASITKRLDASWSVGTNAGGLDTGSIADGTYHVWLIKRSDTGVVDVLFSLSASAPTMPSGYGYKRRIGSIIRSGGAILQFKQDFEFFQFMSPVADVSANNPGTSAVLRTLSVPVGIRVQAIFRAAIINASSGAEPRTIFSDPLTTDIAPPPVAGSVGVAPGADFALIENVSGLPRESSARFMVFTNTSAQIRSRLSDSDGNVTLYINTIGWIDYRME